MDGRACMINLMADIIGLDDTFAGDRLNDDACWQQFMDQVFQRMANFPDDAIRAKLNAIDRHEFQQWIDDPAFWRQIDAEIVRRGQVFKTLMPSTQQGHC